MVQNNDINLNNELNTNKFKLVFREVKGVELLCKGVSFPSLDANALELPNINNRIFVQSTKVNYSPLTVVFKVDENLEAYKELLAWFTAIHSPQNFEQFKKFQTELRMPINGKTVVGFDASLLTLKNSDNINLEVHFVHLFPTNISGWEFGLDGDEHITASATFQYDYFYFN